MPWNRLRERKNGILWFGTDADTRDHWSITDPESERLEAACERLRPDNYYVGGEYVGDKLTPAERQRNDDIYVVLRCVHDYQHLTTYELGVEHILKKLRVIWRALREASREGERDDDRR